MPEFFRSTAKKPGATKVRKGYKKGDWIQGAIKRPGAFTKKAKAADGGRIGKANGGLSHVSGYRPVLGNNRFGYPSGGVPVRSFKGGGAALRGLGRAFTKS